MVFIFTQPKPSTLWNQDRISWSRSSARGMRSMEWPLSLLRLGFFQIPSRDMKHGVDCLGTIEHVQPLDREWMKLHAGNLPSEMTMLQRIFCCFRMFSNNIGKARKIRPGKFQGSGNWTTIHLVQSCNFILDLPRIWTKIRSPAAWKILSCLWKKKPRPAEEENEAKKWESWVELTRRVELWIRIWADDGQHLFPTVFIFFCHLTGVLIFLLFNCPCGKMTGSSSWIICGRWDAHFVPFAWFHNCVFHPTEWYDDDGDHDDYYF